MTREDATIQDAIHCVNVLLEKEVCEECVFYGNCGIYCKDVYGLILKALEKQIPKKPINKELKKYSGGTQVLFADCPMCEQPVKIYNGHQNNKEFRRDEDVYCNHCGQALDWSDEDEGEAGHAIVKEVCKELREEPEE